jgi:hypothetical protein
LGESLVERIETRKNAGAFVAVGAFEREAELRKGVHERGLRIGHLSRGRAGDRKQQGQSHDGSGRFIGFDRRL